MHILVRCSADSAVVNVFFSYCVAGRKRRFPGRTLQSMLIVFSSWFYMLYNFVFMWIMKSLNECVVLLQTQVVHAVQQIIIVDVSSVMSLLSLT